MFPNLSKTDSWGGSAKKVWNVAATLHYFYRNLLPSAADSSPLSISLGTQRHLVASRHFTVPRRPWVTGSVSAQHPHTLTNAPNR
jgi:hypothetical protein